MTDKPDFSLRPDTPEPPGETASYWAYLRRERPPLFGLMAVGVGFSILFASLYVRPEAAPTTAATAEIVAVLAPSGASGAVRVVIRYDDSGVTRNQELTLSAQEAAALEPGVALPILYTPGAVRSAAPARAADPRAGGGGWGAGAPLLIGCALAGVGLAVCAPSAAAAARRRAAASAGAPTSGVVVAVSPVSPARRIVGLGAPRLWRIAYAYEREGAAYRGVSRPGPKDRFAGLSPGAGLALRVDPRRPTASIWTGDLL